MDGNQAEGWADVLRLVARTQFRTDPYAIRTGGVCTAWMLYWFFAKGCNETEVLRFRAQRVRAAAIRQARAQRRAGPALPDHHPNHARWRGLGLRTADEVALDAYEFAATRRLQFICAKHGTDVLDACSASSTRWYDPVTEKLPDPLKRRGIVWPPGSDLEKYIGPVVVRIPSPSAEQ